MAKMQQPDDQFSNGVNLLISILVRFPEIGTINFDADKSTIKLTFMLSCIPTGEAFTVLKDRLLQHLAAYHFLEGREAATIDVLLSSCDEVAMLTILRDVSTFSKGEIALIITLLRDALKECLVTDVHDSSYEDEVMAQDEVIDNMLENVKIYHNGHGLIGIREDGRVLVFNK
jgi:hypothetical protein